MHTTKITEFHNNNQCVSVNITWLDREYMNYLDWSKKPLLALVDRNVFRSCFISATELPDDIYEKSQNFF